MECGQTIQIGRIHTEQIPHLQERKHPNHVARGLTRIEDIPIDLVLISVVPHDFRHLVDRFGPTPAERVDTGVDNQTGCSQQFQFETTNVTERVGVVEANVSGESLGVEGPALDESGSCDEPLNSG